MSPVELFGVGVKSTGDGTDLDVGCGDLTLRFGGGAKLRLGGGAN